MALHWFSLFCLWTATAVKTFFGALSFIWFQGLSCSWLGRAAFLCYSILKVVKGCIPFFFKWEEMEVESGTKKIVRFRGPWNQKCPFVCYRNRGKLNFNFENWELEAVAEQTLMLFQSSCSLHILRSWFKKFKVLSCGWREFREL